MSRYQLETLGDRQVKHRADSSLPRCRSTGAAKDAPLLVATSWGAELAANEAALAEQRKRAAPWLPEDWEDDQ